MNTKPTLTTDILQQEAKTFALLESQHQEPTLYGVTDGKAVGTYLEQKFKRELQQVYSFVEGNSAEGIDLPGLLIDIKTTSIRQPQSSCPFKSARQKVYGLGYALLVFVYDKRDDPATATATLQVQHVIFIESERTSDFQTTSGLRRIIENQGNEDDIVAYFSERMLPLDEIGARTLAQEVLLRPPLIGCLTISNALQWRLQYTRSITQAGSTSGVIRIL